MSLTLRYIDEAGKVVTTLPRRDQADRVFFDTH